MKNQKIEVDRKTAEVSLKGLEETLKLKLSEEEALAIEVRGIEEAITRLKSKLDQLAYQDSKNSGGKTRRRKGENEKLIFELFQKNPGDGFSASIVAEKIGTSPSAAQLAMNRRKDVYELGADGLWRMKPLTASTLLKGTGS